METIARIGDVFRGLAPPPYSQELIESDTEEDDYLLHAAAKRTKTDVPFMVLQGTFMIILMFFLGYCIINGDITRITKGFDNCGNVCGINNNFEIQYSRDCHATNMTEKPYLFIHADHRECVKSCNSANIIIENRCFYTGGTANEANRDFQSFINGIASDLHICSNEIIILCGIALAFAFIMLLVLRYMAGIFVWSVLIGVVIVFGSTTGYFWYLTDITEESMPLAIGSSIFTLIIILVIMVMRKRIELVIQLLKESGKSITAMPLLTLEPILTFVALGILWTAWVYCMVWIESAGTPTEINGNVVYQQNAVIRFTRWYNFFIMLWMVQFVYGCQNMLLAGAISTWFFTRNKNRLGAPIYKSAQNMIKYHLGTVSCGSLIIALIQIIRVLFRSLRRPFTLVKCLLCLCCMKNYVESMLGYLEAWMKYFTRNAYVITSIHGSPFYESGSRAFKLLVENAVRVLTINSVGDFVLVLAKILVVAMTVLIGVFMFKDKEHLNNLATPIILVGFISYLIAHCFITVYEMAIDTIFICFCEDCKINDGLARPYYMSQELMQFVENSKAVLGITVIQEHPINVSV